MIEEIEKQLTLTADLMQPSKDTLHRRAARSCLRDPSLPFERLSCESLHSLRRARYMPVWLSRPLCSPVDTAEMETAHERLLSLQARAGRRFGNTSSSSIWYVLANIESRKGVRRGDRVWQIAFGSGFKCNSAIWRALKNVKDDHACWR